LLKLTQKLIRLLLRRRSRILIKKLILFIIGLSVLALAVFGLLKLAGHPLIEGSRAGFKSRLDIILNNLAGSISPQRSYPLTTVDMEASLKTYLVVPFGAFHQDDWKWFWNLLYGTIEEDSGAWPKRKRQRSREEIQNSLAYYYSQPFGAFGDQQWTSFWQYVLKGKVFN